MGTNVSRCFDNSTARNRDDYFCDRVLRIEILDDGFGSERSTNDSTQSVDEQDSFSCQAMTIKVSSIRLANMSPFFLKMFSNGMKESREQQFTLKISSYEEAPFMDLLDYIKTKTLPKRDPPEMLELLLMADKFEVSTCITSCIDSLLSLPMTCEFALLFSGLPTPISMSITFQSLMDHVQDFFAKSLKTLDVFPEDIGGVDQAIIKTVLSRNDLLLDSEDVAYDFLMKWIDMTHFSDSEGKRNFLRSHVRKLIRFPHMSYSKLSEFYSFHPYMPKKLVMDIQVECDAYKEQQRNKQCTVKKVELRRSNKLLYAKRLYKFRLVAVDKPKTHGEGYTVWLKLEKDDLGNLERLAVQHSNTFLVGDQEFYLAIECKSRYKEDKPCSLGMRLHKRRLQGLTVVDFKVKVKTADGEMVKRGDSQTISVFNRRKPSIGVDYLFKEEEWDELMSDDCKFFINGTMTLTATIRIIR